MGKTVSCTNFAKVSEKVGVFGVRLATPLIGEKGGRIRNNHGHEGEKAAFGQEADWCDYSAAGTKGRTGVVVMCDPANTHRSRFLVREYGVVAANPFGGKGLVLQRWLLSSSSSVVRCTVARG
jgi:hypothetical protein